MASSSTHNHHHCHFPTAAPPPTPTTDHHPPSSPTPSLLSHLLLRLPPTLSLPNRRLSPPLPSFSSTSLISSAAATKLGYFQLTNHLIPPNLPHVALSEALSLFSDKTLLISPSSFPLGYDNNDDIESFCFGLGSFTELTRSLEELARVLEKIGLEVLDKVANVVGFDNPVREDPIRVCSLMWVSREKGGAGSSSTGDDVAITLGRVYPYVVGLEYQVRRRELGLMTDAGRVTISPEVGSVMVTLGDIAQVWSNGKITKVRGRPVPIISSDGYKNNTDNENCISMTMLLTLPLESIVSPKLPLTSKTMEGEKDERAVDLREKDAEMFGRFSFEESLERLHLASKTMEGEKDDQSGDLREKDASILFDPVSFEEPLERLHLTSKTMEGEKDDQAACVRGKDALVFDPFSFEDYAQRVYRERLHLKDPLDEYRRI